MFASWPLIKGAALGNVMGKGVHQGFSILLLPGFLGYTHCLPDQALSRDPQRHRTSSLSASSADGSSMRSSLAAPRRTCFAPAQVPVLGPNLALFPAPQSRSRRLAAPASRLSNLCLC